MYRSQGIVWSPGSRGLVSDAPNVHLKVSWMHSGVSSVWLHYSFPFSSQGSVFLKPLLESNISPFTYRYHHSTHHNNILLLITVNISLLETTASFCFNNQWSNNENPMNHFHLIIIVILLFMSSFLIFSVYKGFFLSFFLLV